MNPLFLSRKGEALLGRQGLTLEGLSAEFKGFFQQEDPRYIDDVSKLAGIAAGRALGGGESRLTDEVRKDFAVIVGSAFGAIDSTMAFDAQALAKGPNAVNPMDFPNTVANAAGSRIGIWLQLKGPNVTLTNGGTSFLDALGYGLQGVNYGLFRDCFVGGVDKAPEFLKTLISSGKPADFREGAYLFLASGSEGEKPLGRIVDFFSVQLRPDLTLPEVFSSPFEELWRGVEWLGCPEGMALETRFPQGLARHFIPSTVLELGLGGLGSLEAFLTAPFSCGVVGAFSRQERKVSFVKIKK